MNANEAYFFRNRGHWEWNVSFELVSWSTLWKAEIPLFSKVSLSFLTLTQQILGALQMSTFVNFQGSSNIVGHSTAMKKWGFTIYRSEKQFFLEGNGSDLRLTGSEYYWPLSFFGIPFGETMGKVEPSTIRATYKMPMAGTLCDCEAFLGMPEGYIVVTSPWIKGRFTLTNESNRVLRSRFETPST